MRKNMIGICGDNCQFCPRYTATRKGDQKEFEKIKEAWAAGKAYKQDIGKEDKREVATKFDGYDLEVRRDPLAERDFYCEMEELTFALHSRWTKYSNDDEKGLAQNYAAAVQYIKDELHKQGYQEVTEQFAVLLDSILSSTWYPSWWGL